VKSNRVEQHQINKHNPVWKLIDDYCLRSKNLYNYANYIIRQEFINNSKWIRCSTIDKMLQNSEPYKELGSQASQKTLELLDKNWKSFFVAIKDWSKNPSKYLGRPRLPKYKDKNGRSIFILKNIQFNIKDGYLRFSFRPLYPLNNIFKTNVKGKLMQVRFIPKGSSYILEITYEIDVPEINQDINNIIGIDLGLNNFATITNNIGLKPIVINGKIIKSINQYYNKKKAEYVSDLKKRHDRNWSNKLQRLTDKRNNKIKDYIHKTSRYIINYCIDNNIDTIVIGNNKNWKQEIELGKRINQNFVQIPYEMLISQLQYKTQNVGIKVIVTEESYTSKASFLDNDELPKYKKDSDNKYKFSGKRIKRGMYKSKEGILVNADVNGSYNIIRKVVPNAFANGIEGVGLHPIRVNVA